jgi:TetR/AcrR family tetracycline transcriptional repressor
MALSRDEVVRAAIALLDEVGLEGLTLRRLAAQLGVQAPTLYWHVKDKRQLLDLMAEAIAAESPAPPAPAQGQPWWEWLAERARAYRRALLSHRDAALVIAGNRPTIDALPRIEELLTGLVTIGFPPGEALQTVFALGAYVGGEAIEVQATARRPMPTEAELAIGETLREGDTYPTLSEAAKTILSKPSDATFEHGLALLITGLRTRHDTLTAPAAGSAAPLTPLRRRAQMGGRTRSHTRVHRDGDQPPSR